MSGDPSLDSGRHPIRIAVVGTEGAGKTVLLCTLAKRFGPHRQREVFFNPRTTQTLKYVERIWSTMQSGEWPSPTTPGQLFELIWTLQVAGEPDCHLRVMDPPGHDLRLLFDPEQAGTDSELPAHLQPLAEECQAADMIVFLISLKDFLGSVAPERRISTEAAVKAAMDWSAANRKRICLVLTQADQHQAHAGQRGGWPQLLAECAPNVFGAHFLRNPIPLLPVAAVWDTELAIDEKGRPRRVPRRQFRSAGLKNILKWIVTQAREVRGERCPQCGHSEGWNDAACEFCSAPPPAPAPPPLPTASEELHHTWLWSAGILVMIFSFGAGLRGCTASPLTPTVKQPQVIPVDYEWGVITGFLWDQVWMRNTSPQSITNVQLIVLPQGAEPTHTQNRLTFTAAELAAQHSATWDLAFGAPPLAPDQAVSFPRCDQNAHEWKDSR